MDFTAGDYGIRTKINEEEPYNIINDNPNAKLYFHDTLLCNRSWPESGPLCWDAVNKKFYVATATAADVAKPKITSKNKKSLKKLINK